jgi:hypothetical protein
MMALRDPRLIVHRGLATWGERLVPLEEFRRAAQAAGRRLDPAAREAAITTFVSPVGDRAAIEGPFERIAVFGGVYSNHFALSALLEAAEHLHCDAVYCLGDLGAFGPNPDKVQPLLAQGAVLAIQGNYEESLASGREDCNCGYTDPRDNYFAALSYRYTARNTSPGFKGWMGGLPKARRVRIGRRELLLAHGSPRRVNEFLFASTSPVAFLEVLLDQYACDGLLVTHTGLPWHRRLPSGRDVVNAGVIGRPANDGRREVWWCLLADRGENLGVELRPLAYDWQGLAAEMRAERLPEEFVATIETGWWTTCLEILPAKERAAGRF